MSFKFNWDSFTNDDHFYERATTLLTEALNRGKRPSILADKIKVRELYLGDESPQLEILEVGDLADDRFRGIFKLTYNGNASITLATKIRANPLQVYAMSAPDFSLPKFQGSSQASLAIPLNLTLSDIKLSGIIILVFSKAKGLTLVFRNDPLQSIRVTSTFDTLPGIARFLQTQIERQIRSLFREDLPAILHKLSHRWTPSGSLMLEKQRLQQHLEEQQAAAAAAVATAEAAAPSEMSLNDNKSQLATKVSEKLASDPPAYTPSSRRPSEDITPQQQEVVSFADINPDMPGFSADNMQKLHSLCANQLTLSLFTPAIHNSVYRANLFLFDMNNSTIQNLEGNIDLDDIARIQSRNYFRNSHTKPKRRVIKINKSNSQQQQTEPQPLQSKQESPVPSTPEQTLLVDKPQQKQAHHKRVPQHSVPAASQLRTSSNPVYMLAGQKPSKNVSKPVVLAHGQSEAQPKPTSKSLLGVTTPLEQVINASDTLENTLKTSLTLDTSLEVPARPQEKSKLQSPKKTQQRSSERSQPTTPRKKAQNVETPHTIQSIQTPVKNETAFSISMSDPSFTKSQQLYPESPSPLAMRKIRDARGLQKSRSNTYINSLLSLKKGWDVAAALPKTNARGKRANAIDADSDSEVDNTVEYPPPPAYVA